MTETTTRPVLSPAPHRTPMIDRGTLLATRQWIAWFETSWRRQGQADAPSNSELDEGLTQTQDELAQTQDELTQTQSALAQTHAEVDALEADLAAKLPDGTPLSVARYQADGSGVEASPNVVVDANGNLGVGTAAPNYRLTVANGNIGITRDDGAPAQLALNTPSGFLRQMQWQTNGVQRWNLVVSTEAETGSHQGSNLSLVRRADDGTNLSTVLRFERSTGHVQQGTFATDPTARNLWILGSGTGPSATLPNAIALWAADRGAVANKMALHVRNEDGTSHVLGDLVGLGTLCTATLGSGASYQALNVKGSTLYTGQSSVQERPTALVASTFVVSTDATRTTRLALSAYDSVGAREGLRIEADGSAARLGFYGQPAVARPTVPAAATDPATTQALANGLRAALVSLGLAA